MNRDNCDIIEKVKYCILNTPLSNYFVNSAYYFYYNVLNTFLKNRRKGYDYVEIIRNDYNEYNVEYKNSISNSPSKNELVKFLVYKDFERSSTNYVQSTFNFRGNRRNCEIYLFKLTFTRACWTIDDIKKLLDENTIITFEKINFSHGSNITLNLETNIVIDSTKLKNTSKDDQQTTQDNSFNSFEEEEDTSNPDHSKWNKQFYIYFFVAM